MGWSSRSEFGRVDPVWARRLAKQSEQLHEPYQCDGLGCIKTLVCLEKFNEPYAFTEHLCFKCGDQQEAWGQGTPAVCRRIPAGGVGRLSTFGNRLLVAVSGR